MALVKIVIIIQIFAFSALAETYDCERPVAVDIFTDLNNATIDDTQIVTEDDLRFCPNQSIKNANISPKDLPDNGSVWRVGNRRWNDEWEKEYQRWIKDNFHSDFFVELDFPTDCADAAIAVRSIFARIHNLPVSFNGDHYSNTQKGHAKYKTVTHWSPSNWKESFKKDTRFKKALKSWLVGTGTINLHLDTYQIDLAGDQPNTISSCVAPGTVFLEGGHTQILTYKEGSMFPYRLSSSTIPADVRPLEENILSYIGAYNDADPHLAATRGYLWWNWTVNCGGKFKKVKDKNMPYYSSMQEEDNLAGYGEEGEFFYDINKAYQQSLGMSDEQIQDSLYLEAKQLIGEIEKAVDIRMEIVKEGYEACMRNGITSAFECFKPTSEAFGLKFEINQDGTIECEECGDMSWANSFDYLELFKPLNATTKQLYYEHSTPSRDARLSEKLEMLQELKYQLSRERQKQLDLEMLDKKIDIGNGKSITYYHLIDDLNLSSQPWDTLGERWGEISMNEKYDRFAGRNSDQITAYANLKETNRIENSEASKLNLDSFIEENKFFIKEYDVFKDFFDLD